MADRDVEQAADTADIEIPRCQHVSASPWGPTQCALGLGHKDRHAYSPSESIPTPPIEQGADLAAADGLRNELEALTRNAFFDARNDGRTMYEASDDAARRMLPVVVAYADAQVADERERIAVEVEAMREKREASSSWLAGFIAAREQAARIVRG
ncbi:MAG: hypothetical protein ACREF4_13690, partial [Gammaproteobacteria bacterium]